MLNVDYIEDKSSQRVSTRVVVNGIYDKDSYVLSTITGEFVQVYKSKIVKIISEEPIVEVLRAFNEVEIPLEEKYYPVLISNHDWSSITMKREGENGVNITFNFQFDTQEWSQNFSINLLGERLKEKCATNLFIHYDLEDEEMISNGFKFTSYYKIKDTRVLEILETSSKQINKLFNEVVEKLNNEFKLNSFDFVFNINDDIKNACEQYLIYFTQFLRDIGINASSNMSEEIHKILFSVTPKDSNIALEHINNALAVYLELPRYNEILNIDSNEVAILQLQANIHHLKSQLVLAKATIEANKKTINLLELKNSNTLENIANRNEVEILDGIIKISDYEQNGFKINIPELIRRLKRKFA